jgi:hypothetical protein
MRCSDDIKKLKPIWTNARRKIEIYAVSLIASRNTSTFSRNFSRNYEVKQQAINAPSTEKDFRP